MAHRTFLYREISQILHFSQVPIHHCGVDLKGQAGFPAGAHPVHRTLPGPGGSPEYIVAGRVNAVQANPHGSSPGLFQPFGHRAGKEGTVGAENRPQALFPGMFDQGTDIFTQQRFTPAEDHNLKPRSGNLVNQHQAFFSAQFLPGLNSGIPVTMPAKHIAGIGGVP
ncbi:MAG: hypothetical protein BWY80_01271 [Firmicutes bacterium ADurb.Bin456]|nr:MAG: hypothetical protein BWY80_01271 [Firmicutes bacterium ADurb.Bin456]